MTSFDRKSGVTYTERTSAPVQSMVTKWSSQVRGRSSAKTFLKSRGKRCDSLQNMVLRACAWNVELFLPETLKWAGWFFTKRIWKKLKDSETLTFNAWNLFMEAYPKEINESHEFRIDGLKDRATPVQLPLIIDRLSKLNVDALTFLAVRDFRLTFDDLINLTRIPSLGALALSQIRDFNEHITVRNLRDWGRVVQESCSFKRLRTLLLHNFGTRTEGILDALTDFPALSIIGLQHSYNDNEMRDSHNCGQWILFGSDYDKFNAALNPARIWWSHDSTTSEKLKQVYDISQQLQQSQPQCAPYKSVGIAYLGASVPLDWNNGAWYYRTIHDDKERSAKRTKVSGQSDEPQDQNKKRKIRSGKQKDVSALLDSFH